MPKLAILNSSSPLQALRETLQDMDEEAALRFFNPKKCERLLKSTISLCPDCLSYVPALVFTSAGRVLMSKVCEMHGHTEAVLENDETFYYVSNKDRSGRCFAPEKVMEFLEYEGDCCGGGCCSSAENEGGENFADQRSNKSCTILVEVTNACNLACAVCYSDARGDRKLPLHLFKEYLTRLIEIKGTLDSVQLTGGEAVLHPEFWDMVSFLYESPVKKIYIPTNGIVFSDPKVASRLLPFADKLMVLLQFDGEASGTNRALRNANPEQLRSKVIENLSNLGIHMQLTMTITQGVNDHEIGEVVETGFAHPQIKVIALQPVTYSGRYTLSQNPTQRMTLSDCVKGVAAQIRRRTRTSDFKPIPCSHPNCGWITLFVQRFGLTANIARHINLEQVKAQVSNRTLLNSSELRSAVGTEKVDSLITRIGVWGGRKLIRSTDIFTIAIKPFMDRFNYDQDRIASCCHHLLDTRGNPISFCEYNARIRPNDRWDAFPTLTSGQRANA